MNVRRLSILAAVAFIASAPVVTAQPTSQLTDQDFSRTTRSVLVSELVRWFTFNQIKKAELTDAIANTLLMTSLGQQAQGRSAQAVATETKFERESKTLSTLIAALQKDPSAKAAARQLTEIAKDRAVQLSATNDTEVMASPAGQALTRHESTLLGDIDEILARTDAATKPTAVSEVVAAFAKHEADAAEHLTQTVNVVTKLDDMTDDPELEQELSRVEDNAIETAKTFDETTTSKAVDALKSVLATDRQIVVLAKLADVAPDAAKPALNAVIDRLAQTITSGTDASSQMTAILNQSGLSADLQEKLLERLKQHADETTKQLIETAKKTAEKQRDAAKEAAKEESDSNNSSGKSKSSTSSDRDSSANKKDSPSGSSESSSSPPSGSSSSGLGTNSQTPSGSPSSTTGTGSSGSSESSQAKQETVQVKVKDGAFDGDSSFSLASGTVVTVQFENDDSTARTLTVSNGTSSRSVANGSKTTLPSFTLGSTVTFTVSGIAGSGTIAVK